jgi:hypothetical protein
VNGNPIGFFSSPCCLILGDHLSPFLFVNVMEASSKMLSTTVNEGNLSSFLVGSRHYGVVEIAHLSFAGDTLAFCGVNLFFDV